MPNYFWKFAHCQHEEMGLHHDLKTNKQMKNQTKQQQNLLR